MIQKLRAIGKGRKAQLNVFVTIVITKGLKVDFKLITNINI